jgi:hypothetical protein
MMKTLQYWKLCLLAAVIGVFLNRLPAQNTSQQLAFAGLRSIAAQGQINAVKTDSAGNIYLLLDQKDGVRLLKTDNAASKILAQAQLGARGDIGLAMALDPAGNVYITGTTTSATLTATTGAAIPNRTDTSTQSFVAKFSPDLSPVFVTFTGGSKIAASALTSTADSVFVTGVTYAANLPVTPNGIQQTPAYQSTQNGFVEKFSATGASLLYATYLTGANGDTTPTSIVADSADNAYITGATSASGFPTIAALVPAILSNPSGFLTKLTPAGDGIVFSTFIPGPGITSIALDTTSQTLLLSGSVELGKFPVDKVSTPLIPTTYQVLLRLPLDGSAVESATLIAPGTQSFVAPGPSGTVWVDGSLTAPLLPLTPLADLGNAFAVRVNAANAIDQTARFGGLPTANPSFSNLPAVITSIAVDPGGNPYIAGAIQPTASSSLLTSETYDLPLRNSPTAAFPSAIMDAEATAATCSGSLCSGSAAYLVKLNPNASAPTLSFSTNDLPFVTLRNLGTAEADNLTLTTNSGTLSSNCPTTLYPGGQCVALLSGGAAGTLTASTSNAPNQTAPFASYTAPSSTIASSPRELDFGIQTAVSAITTKTITISNLGTTSQTFTSINATSSTSPFSEQSSDCTLSDSIHNKVLSPGGSCHITLAFTPFTSAASDGFQSGDWNIGTRSIHLTAYGQAAALSVSTSEIDFGTQFTNGLRLPRYLYISNSSASPISHSALALPAGSPFTLTDACPATLLPASVCRIRIDYLSTKSPSTDSVSLTLDGGLSVLITGETLPPKTVSGSTVNPNLSVTPSTINFANPVIVTGVSSTSQTVSISNTGASAFTLSLSLTGDFNQTTSCPPTLPGGQTCASVITFAPSQPGSRQGLLAITAGAGTSPAYVTLNGAGTAIFPPNNGSLDFGSIPAGQPATQFYKLPQPFSTLTATASGPYSLAIVEDSGTGPIPPATFASSVTSTCHICYLAVRFLPTAAGSQPGNLILTSAPTGSAYAVALTGNGVSLTGLLLTPSTQDFGSIPVHSVSAPTLFTLTNLTTGANTVQLSSPVITGDFLLNTTPTGGQPCNGTLAYGASCLLQISFAPTITGTRTGTLSIAAGSFTALASITGLASPESGLALNPTALVFANVPGPTSTRQTITLTNTGTSQLGIMPPTLSTAAFQANSACASLAPAASCTITVTFTPAPAIATETLSIPVTSRTGGTTQTTTYTVSLKGSYTNADAGLQITPSETLFGPASTGSASVPREFTINNLTAKSVSLNLNIPRQYTLTIPPCTSLGPNASCTFSAAFLPLTGGDISGTLYAQGTPTDGSPVLNGLAYLEGFGIGQGTLTVTGALITGNTFSFGQVTSGQTASQTFTLINRNPTGSAPITVHRVTSGPPFLSTTTCGQPLAVNQSCTVTVTYAPTNQVASGTASPPSTPDAGTLTIESDAAQSPYVLAINGQAGPVAVGNPANSVPLATYLLSQNSLVFPSIPVGNLSTPQTVTVTNTGTVALHVTGLIATPDFTAQNACGTVAPSTTCTLTITSTPQTAGPHNAALEIATDSSTSLEFLSLVSIASAPPLTLSPLALDFDGVLIGASAKLAVQVTNASASPVSFTSISASGDYSTSTTCTGTLAANASCTIQVAFTPTATGVRPGTLSIASSATALPLTVALTGTGLQPRLLVSSNNLAFGDVIVGTPASLSLTLTNSGSIPITNVALTASSDYAVTTPCPATTLAAGATCTVQVTFTPSAVGSRPGTLAITSSDPGSPVTIPLTGNGIAAGSFSLTVDGGPSSSVSVPSGQPATYHLLVTPTGNFSSPVDLTCAPVTPAQYATCSLTPSTLTPGGSPATAMAVINTITSAGGNARVEVPASTSMSEVLACLLLPGILGIWKIRRRLRGRLPVLLSLFFTAMSLIALGCGGGVNSTVRVTPPGTYQYIVTASSTSGTPVTQTVTLNLTVTAH